ncbi:hypothetical protein [Gimesia aquarii]|uniref:Uncharacterized protein n=1 Tax=Gimesia aquarii TaxID=2527964 RepID=A0A517WQL3_9PLAN|nr:hypothetical protein [Gimesia aquarii]QDU07526.1 hypothetical protein V202x_08830 [Gimesia aquarii]
MSNLSRKDPVTIVERDARNQLAVLIRRYLDDQLMSFDFDDALKDFPDTDDTTVKFVIETVWYFYDDCKDHSVVLTKPEWDYFQRLVLLLESNSTVIVKKTRLWSFAKPVAAILLLVCLLIVWLTGIGDHLLIFFIPFGIGSILLSFFHRPEAKENPFHEAVTPFQSISDLSIAYESTNFVKRQYPSDLESRRIRSFDFRMPVWMSYVILCLFFAPLLLLIQCFRQTITNVRVNPA